MLGLGQNSGDAGPYPYETGTEEASPLATENTPVPCSSMRASMTGRD